MMSYGHTGTQGANPDDGTKQQLPLGKARPGMWLAEAVLDGRGRMLLPGGCILSQGLLAALARRDVASIMVRTNHGAPALLSEEDKERASRRVAYLFRRCNGDELTRSLAEAIQDLRTGRSA